MSYVKSEAELLSEISQKLDTILGLLAIRTIGDDPGVIVERLHQMKLNPKAIARASGLTENAVNLRLSRMKKKKTVAKLPSA